MVSRKYNRYFKNFKRWRNYDVFGPTKKVPDKLKSFSGGTTFVKPGNSYLIKIPKGENTRYWTNSWDGQLVFLLGFQQLFHHGQQIVCVEKNKKFLTLPVNWIILPRKTGCSCSTSTIWSQGCQCGGN